MAVENADIRYFDFAIQTIAAIPVFRGERSSLDAFIRQMDAACAVAAEVQASEPVKACLGFQFLNRISPEVQQATRISIVMAWAEARARLRDHYGGMLRPLSRHAWKAMTLERGRGEKEAEYAHRLAGELRLLKRRVLEAGYGEAEATWRVTIYEELSVENLRRNVSESTRKALMSPKITTVEEATRIVEDEEAAAQEYRATTPWVEVRRRNRPSPPRMRLPPPPTPPRRSAARQRAPQPRTRTSPRENRPGPKPECWACGQTGHFKRECPHMYHREKRYTKPPYEPMEVNAGKWIWQAESEEEYASSDDGSTASGRQRASFAEVVKEKTRGKEAPSPGVSEGNPIRQ